MAYVLPIPIGGDVCTEPGVTLQKAVFLRVLAAGRKAATEPLNTLHEPPLDDPSGRNALLEKRCR
jgi:hypothetical protein